LRAHNIKERRGIIRVKLEGEGDGSVTPVFQDKRIEIPRKGYVVVTLLQAKSPFTQKSDRSL
jgi:hypothetical protein